MDCRENPVKPEIVPIEKRIREIEEKERLALGMILIFIIFFSFSSSFNTSFFKILENSVQETPLTQFFMKKMEEKYKRLVKAHVF